MNLQHILGHIKPYSLRIKIWFKKNRYQLLTALLNTAILVIAWIGLTIGYQGVKSLANKIDRAVNYHDDSMRDVHNKQNDYIACLASLSGRKITSVDLENCKAEFEKETQQQPEEQPQRPQRPQGPQSPQDPQNPPEEECIIEVLENCL